MNLVVVISKDPVDKLKGIPAIIYKFDDFNAKYKVILSYDRKTILVEKHNQKNTLSLRLLANL